MGRSSREPQSSSPHDGHAANSTRRVFLGRIIGGLAIAIPAFRMLANPSSASADTHNIPLAPMSTPDACGGSCPGPCSKTYEVYDGHQCGGEAFGSCPAGFLTNCIGYYTRYSVSTGQYCSSFTDNEGPCG